MREEEFSVLGTFKLLTQAKTPPLSPPTNQPLDNPNPTQGPHQLSDGFVIDNNYLELHIDWPSKQ